MSETPSLSRGEVTRGLHTFIIISGVWGAWGQMLGIGTAVFTGYAIYLGADASDIAMLTALASLMAIVQLPATSFLGTRIANKKRLIIGAGFFEVLFRGLVLVIPLIVAPSFHIGLLVAFVMLGLFFGHVMSPFYGSWVASTIPEDIRARFTSRSTTVSSLVGMVAAFLAGKFVDSFSASDKHLAFTYIFVVGTLLGWLGYVFLSSAPFPRVNYTRGGSGKLQMLIRPFRDTNFRRLILFYSLWNFAIGLAGPLYSVFMLQELKISYTTISVFTALFLSMTILGYRVWAGFVDRFGSKPVLQILLAPHIMIPVLWVFNRPDAYLMIPVALIFSGLIFSGVSVSITALLYGMLPEGEERPVYLASWSTMVNLIAALGPLAGGVLVRALSGVHTEFFNTPIASMQIVFMVSAAALVIPNLMLRTVVEVGASSSRHLLGQIFKGNLLSYAYNATVYSIVTEEDRRARAALALGKSGNPLAIHQLVQALADAGPKVRAYAARALGETDSEQAVEPLTRELMDSHSDIRSEAAEALGRLGRAEGVDPLIEALDDPDPRVRISAIRGLAEMGGEEAQELLFWQFNSDFDPATFPTLVDALGGMEDRRVVKPALEHLSQFPSPAIRLQLLNAVCRSLGSDGEFHRLIRYEPTKRHAALGRLLRRSQSAMAESRALDVHTRTALRDRFAEMICAFDIDDQGATVEGVRRIIEILRGVLASGRQKTYETLMIYVISLAIEAFLRRSLDEDIPYAREVFLVVCLQRMAKFTKDLGD